MYIIFLFFPPLLMISVVKHFSFDMTTFLPLANPCQLYRFFATVPISLSYDWLTSAYYIVYCHLSRLAKLMNTKWLICRHFCSLASKNNQGVLYIRGLVPENVPFNKPDAYVWLSLFCRPGEEPVSVTDLLDLGSVPVAPVGSSPPSSASILPCASGSSPPSSSSSSCQPVEVPSTRTTVEPEPSPPSSQSSLTPSTHTGAALSLTVSVKLLWNASPRGYAQRILQRKIYTQKFAKIH